MWLLAERVDGPHVMLPSETATDSSSMSPLQGPREGKCNTVSWKTVSPTVLGSVQVVPGSKGLLRVFDPDSPSCRTGGMGLGEGWKKQATVVQDQSLGPTLSARFVRASPAGGRGKLPQVTPAVIGAPPGTGAARTLVPPASSCVSVSGLRRPPAPSAGHVPPGNPGA